MWRLSSPSASTTTPLRPGLPPLSPKLPSLTPPGAVPSPFVVADRSQAGEEGGGVPGLGLVKDEEI